MEIGERQRRELEHVGQRSDRDQHPRRRFAIVVSNKRQAGRPLDEGQLLGAIMWTSASAWPALDEPPSLDSGDSASSWHEHEPHHREGADVEHRATGPETRS